MVFYHSYQSPCHFYPGAALTWTPYMIATSPSACSQYRCGNKKDTTSDDAKAVETPSKILYHDRNTRVQFMDDGIVEFSLDLPGIKASDTKVEIHDGVLKVQAERKYGNDRTTEFARNFSIRDIADSESECISASLQNGVLRITIPKKVEVGEEKEDDTNSMLIPVLGEYPLLEANEDDTNGFQLSVDLPGVSLANATVEVNDDTIIVHAMRKVFENVSTIKRHIAIDTNKVDVTTLNAYLIDGALTIVGSKKTMPEPKQIVVTDGSATNAVDGIAAMAIEVVAESKEEDDDMVVVETVMDEPKHD